MAGNPRRFKRPLVCALVVLTAVLWGWGGSALEPVRTLEGRSLDWRFQVRGPQGERSPRIVLVLVEEAAELPYRSPIPRDHLAAVVEQLEEAELVGLDIFLDRPSFDEEGDERLRRALRTAGNVVAVSYIEGRREFRGDPYFTEGLLDYGYATFSIGTEREVVRRGTIWRDLEAGRAVSLAGCLFLRSRGIDPAAVRTGRRVVPGRERLIDYSGPPNAVYRIAQEELAGGFTVCPSHLVAKGIYPRQFFRDKIVLVGSGLMDAPDRFRTPFFAAQYGYEKTYGVEVHAHFLRTLLEGSAPREWGTGVGLLVTGLLAALTAALVFKTDALRSSLVVALIVGGWWGAGFALFVWKNWVLPLVVPTLGTGGALGLAITYYALTEGREKRQVRRLFEKYLAPDVVRQLVEDPSSWELGGRTMEITVMFADLEGFTSVAERLDPQDLVSLINEFLTEMSRIIWMEGGTIDKYEGDLIMAFFGAPLPQVDHAARGCRSALRMQARMAELRQEWQRRGLPELRVRIGLHSGQAVVGNMGSDFHFDYTAMGDAVNLASRLEGANKEFGTYVMVSSRTRGLAGEETFAYRELGEILVKGKSEPTQVCELLEAEENT